MKNDRFLTVILATIALLVVVSLGVFFFRQGNLAYQPEDTPEGVVHNYIFALQQGDYERAYRYLAERDFKPAYGKFRQDLLIEQDRGQSLQIGAVDINGDEATVEIIVNHSGGGPFFEQYSYSETALLTRQDGGWKIYQMPYAYWSWGWYQEGD